MREWPVGSRLMNHAEITGWGMCVPPARLTNHDLATFLDTSDEWIVTRSGIRERRVSHVNFSELGLVAARHALAAANVDAAELDPDHARQPDQ